MSHSRDKGKKEKKKPPKEDKNKKGVPPHLQRARENNGSLNEIKRHLDELAERQNRG